MNIKEIEWVSMDSIETSGLALVIKRMKLRVPLNVGKFLSSLATGGFSRRTLLNAVSY
jgi:hypothetical protein